MPVWGVWLDGRLWFSSGMRSRKARNLAVEPRCTLTTDDARNPVVVDGVAEQVTDRAGIEAFVGAVNAKYGGGVSVEFLDPAVNGTFAVRPERVFAISEDDFAGSPTRWTVPAARVSLPTSGMPGAGSRLDPAVQNLWGLTRRRALDFGRVTTAAC